MKYGYYLTLPSIETDAEGNMTRSEQLAETADHVNLLWLDDQRLTPDQIAGLTMRGKAVVLDVAGCLFNGNATDALRPDAEARLGALKLAVGRGGDIRAVKVIVPRDEPNLPESDVQHLIPEAAALIRRVWPEAMLGCIYYNDGEFRNRHLFDVLGFDDYLGGFGICQKPRWYERIKLFFGGFVRRGSYLRFAEMLRPDQRTWLIPGGTYGERPEPWLEFARKRPEVCGIVPFLWASNVDGNTELPGIRALPVRDAYVKAGREICAGGAA